MDLCRSVGWGPVGVVRWLSCVCWLVCCSSVGPLAEIRTRREGKDRFTSTNKWKRRMKHLQRGYKRDSNMKRCKMYGLLVPSLIK